MDNVGRFLKPNKPEDLELLLFSLKNLCCEVLESEVHLNVQVHVIQYNHRINLLFNFPHANLEQQRQDAERLCRMIINSVHRYLKVAVKIGIGSFGHGFRHIAVTYRGSVDCVANKRDRSRSRHYFS